MTSSSIRYIPRPVIKIDGSDAPQGLMEDILQIIIEESLHEPGMFTLVIRNDYYPGRPQDKLWAYENLLTIGKSVEIGFKSSTTEDPNFSTELDENSILKGEITSIEAEFSAESQAPVIIRGYDVSHRLHRGRYNRSFQNKKDSDIVRDVIGEVGISAGTIDDTGGPYGFGDPVGYIFQENQTNMEFLRERAARNGFELFVQNGKLNFRKPAASKTLNLKWLKEIHNFRVRASSMQQVDSVEVRAWDYKNKKPIISTKSSQTSAVITDTQQGKGKDTSKKFGCTPKMIVVDQQVCSQGEADTIAQAVYNELSGEFIYVDGSATGDPKIRVGQAVQLSEMGKYSGKYYVTATRHLYIERNYTTEFSVRGLRGDEMTSTLDPQTRQQPGQNLLVGIVTNNKDPKKWGRVRVKFPTLTEDHESNWARVVAIGAGSGRGFDCLPEVNDEVLVAFEHGDIHRPYVLGGVWNGKDAPSESVDDSVVDGKVRLRTFKTRIGHKQQFVEEDKGSSKVGAYIETKSGHKFHMNDTEKFIEIKTKNGHYVRLDDQSKKIEIKTTGGQKITMDDPTNTIAMSAVQKISLTAPLEIKMTSGPSSITIAPSGIAFQTPAKLSGQAGGILEFQAGGAATMKSGAAMTLQSGATMTAQAGATLNLQAGAAAAIMAAATASVTAPLIRLNC